MEMKPFIINLREILLITCSLDLWVSLFMLYYIKSRINISDIKQMIFLQSLQSL